MKRRAFIGTSIGTGALAAGIPGCSGERQTQTTEAAAPVTMNGRLAGKTLEELREEHRYWLFDDFLPFMDKFVVDHEYGGFMCNTDREGKNITTNKRTWFEGRGIWVYSYLFNNVSDDRQYLDIARKSVEFIMKQNPTGGELMPAGYTREGKPLRDEPDPIFYGDMFVANGFQEYSKAAGDPEYWDMAKRIVLKCVDIYDNRPGYHPLRNADGEIEVERPRILGHWFMLLRCTTQMLEKKRDDQLEEINNRAVDAIMNKHHNPGFDLIVEYMHHDFTPIDGAHGQHVGGHSPETLWMVLAEAVRRKDKALFDRAAAYLKRHCEVLWDDVYGGMMLGLTNVDENTWNTGKALWLQEEILVGTLMIAEHLGLDWAKEWYSRQYAYTLDKFPLRQYGYPLWNLYADRKVTFEKEYTRVGNFHHPRHLMMNLLALDRMIGRGGKLSGLFVT